MLLGWCELAHYWASTVVVFHKLKEITNSNARRGRTGYGSLITCGTRTRKRGGIFREELGVSHHVSRRERREEGKRLSEREREAENERENARMWV